MKKILYIIFCSILVGCNVPWQQTPTKGYERLPNLNMLLLDSSTVLNTQRLPKDRPLIFLYFSPDCTDCQEQASELLGNMRQLKNVTIVYVSPMPLSEIRIFCYRFKLTDYSNILVANDYNYSFFSTYKIQAFPYIIIYNKEHELTKLFIGEVEFDKILNAVKS
jgi:thioredoxin-related protein